MPADTWVIEEVFEQEGPRGIYYEVSLRRPDGVRIARFFDDDTLECRAAEYGLDPDTEIDTLIEMVLYEFHIPDPTQPSNFAQDAAAQAGKMSGSTRAWGRQVAIGDPVPTWLFNSRSTEEAREAHLLRVEAAKKKIRFIPDPSYRRAGKVGDPLDTIRNNAVLNKGVIQAKAKHVRAMVDQGVELAATLQARSQAVGLNYRVNRRVIPPSPAVIHDDAAVRKAESYENHED